MPANPSAAALRAPESDLRQLRRNDGRQGAVQSRCRAFGQADPRGPVVRSADGVHDAPGGLADDARHARPMGVVATFPAISLRVQPASTPPAPPAASLQ